MAEKFSGARVSSVSLGITVILLYGVFVTMVAFGFGSYIYRTGWQVSTVTNGPSVAPADASDIDNLIFILKREQILEARQERLTEEMQAFRAEVSSWDSKVAQSFANIAQAKAALQAQVDSTTADLVEFQFDLPGRGRSKFETVVSQMDITAQIQPDTVGNLSPDFRIRALLNIAAEGFEGDNVDLDTKDRFEAMRTRAIGMLDALSLALAEANAASHDAQARRKLIQDRIAAHQTRWNSHEDSIKASQETLPLGSSARARLSALSLSMPFMPDVLMRLVGFPTIFLTLIVTIAAGGLGTVVAFSRRYYSSTTSSTLTLSRLFVNVGEGIAAAIAIFLFSGAGMLALTQGGGAANDVELSPYTVAFVAFLSGFMAEDAFASIQAAGKRIFKIEKAENGNASPQTPPTDP